MAPRERGATVKTRGAPGSWRPNEVDASSRRRGGEICGRVDGGRHQQAVHAQNTWMPKWPDDPWSTPPYPPPSTSSGGRVLSNKPPQVPHQPRGTKRLPRKPSWRAPRQHPTCRTTLRKARYKLRAIAVTRHKKTTRFHVKKRGNVRRNDRDELLNTVFLNEAPSYVKNQGGLGAEPPEKKLVLHAPDDACCTFTALEVGFCFDAKLRF